MSLFGTYLVMTLILTSKLEELCLRNFKTLQFFLSEKQ